MPQSSLQRIRRRGTRVAQAGEEIDVFLPSKFHGTLLAVATTANEGDQEQDDEENATSRQTHVSRDEKFGRNWRKPDHELWTVRETAMTPGTPRRLAVQTWI